MPTLAQYLAWRVVLDAPALELDLADAGLEPADLEAAAPRLRAALAAMERLEAGAVANPDEQRQVGHYWLRAPELAPTPDLHREITACRLRIHAFAADVHRGQLRGKSGQPLRNLLVIGIGGSALGPELAAAALGGPADRLRPFFCDNTDPDGFDDVLRALAETPAGLAIQTIHSFAQGLIASFRRLLKYRRLKNDCGRQRYTGHAGRI